MITEIEEIPKVEKKLFEEPEKIEEIQFVEEKNPQKQISEEFIEISDI